MKFKNKITVFIYMASFDIESFFTNIPLDETINICVNNVFVNKKRVK